ncbi:MAG TPA: GtrA family protein [Polyangiaceae bacterium]|jgi:putative flippase GtrA|nr:GtrA family protein [Polyangiaceae bacterium]
MPKIGATWWGLGRGSFARNASAGLIATLADFALVAMLVGELGVAPPVATLWGCGLGGVVNFAINRRWAFDPSTTVRSSALRYAFVSATSALLNSAGVALLLGLGALIYAVPYQLVWWFVRGLVSVLYNFPLQRHFVFAHRDIDRAKTPSSVDLRS